MYQDNISPTLAADQRVSVLRNRHSIEGPSGGDASPHGVTHPHPFVSLMTST